MGRQDLSSRRAPESLPLGTGCTWPHAQYQYRGLLPVPGLMSVDPLLVTNRSLFLKENLVML